MKFITCNWFGPYTLEEIQNGEHPYDLSGCGLYCIAGKRRRNSKLSYYIGKTERGYIERFNDKGHVVHELKAERRIYLGKIVKPKKFNHDTIETLEWIYRDFSKYNDITWTECDKKTMNPPKGNYTVITHFFTRDGRELQEFESLFGELPEFIDWILLQGTLYFYSRA